MDHCQDQRHVEMIVRERFARPQPPEKKKDGRILTSRNTFDSDNAHSATNCGRILGGGVAFGESAGRGYILVIFQQIGGSQENGTNHNQENGEISNGGKSGEYSLSDPSAFCKILAHS